MSQPSTGNVLKSKVHDADTIVDWDEFVKLANVGDTYRSGPTDLVIKEKVFEDTRDGYRILLLY